MHELHLVSILISICFLSNFLWQDWEREEKAKERDKGWKIKQCEKEEIATRWFWGRDSKSRYQFTDGFIFVYIYQKMSEYKIYCNVEIAMI